ncbi:FG-GAP repeat domain-containing protein [Nocardioides taihuensis]|uniref:FG-GAP repeat domain-containing protein n=1 Tax=Nocardioides taihuensis TaxID=1835606 RepID=A0ABW0BHL9_9ACTN
MTSHARESRRRARSMLWAVAPLLVVASTVTGTGSAGQVPSAPAGQRAAAPRAATLPARTTTRRVRDITLEVDPHRTGFGAWSQTWGDNLVFDKNGDGNLDVLLSFHLQRWEIWLGSGSGDFTFDRGLHRTDRHNCVAADFGRPADGRPDGRVDLYCVRGADKGTLSDKSNSMFMQRRDGSFVDRVRAWGARDPSGRGRVVSLLTPRPGARPSLFLGDAPSIEFPSLDRLLLNKGGHFRGRHTAGLPADRGTTCSDTADYDHDGRQDFVTCSYWDGGGLTARRLLIYHNETTRGGAVVYRWRAAREGVPQQELRDAELVDMDGDGWADLVTVSRHALVVRLNRHRTPHFSRISYRHSFTAGQSFCTGAANGDHARDLLVVQSLASGTRTRQARDWMLVNRGSGRRFRALPVPQPPRRFGRNGVGDTCSAIPRFRDKRSAWTINNGLYPGAGYRQLVVLSRPRR